ncbi:MAG TPA: hypothetical protein PL063_06610 [Candidatus Cloacimonadota bacterium]|nr:hypothetical protein [Candidatus Cloacimonadota bacterium]HOQ80066.1 hypothetical protein [Candidatus Cloacimonadota bacterium]HPY96867.1 hypothetical protein [Candidatus Cloacimonadota bacterium]HQB41446.1 hypothetical protein [Candidatus Cloacimonadota bacterium]
MADEKSLVHEKALVWAKTNEQKYFSWMTPIKINKLIKEKKKIFTVSNTHNDVQITKCEYSKQEDLYLLKLQSGSKIICSDNIEFNIETIWVAMNEINHYEKLVELNILNNHFRESYAVSIEKVENARAFEFDTEDHTAIINNFLVKLY